MSYYKCNNCGSMKGSFFGLCPSCGEGIGEEIEGPMPKAGVSAAKPNAGSAGSAGVALAVDLGVEDYESHKVSKNQSGGAGVVKVTKYDALNDVLSSRGGFVKDQVVALGASPGVGKSTLCTEICDDDSAYISTEESYDQVNSRFLRVNPDSQADLIATTSLGAILKVIAETDKSLIIVDSLNSINNGADSYIKSAKNMSLIVDAIKTAGKCGIIISQVTKSGEISGMNTILHVVDTVLYLERSEVSSNLLLYSNKNRFGEIGSMAIFDHAPAGLMEIEKEIEDDPVSGVTKSQAKFGFKSMSVAVECLVAPAQGNYGIRKSNGVHPGRLLQILGVLAYHDRSIDFSNKDVYISLRSGVTSHDYALDLAIANSVLSSYYQKVVKFDHPVNGEISLSGFVKGSNNNVSHIKDLIAMYKK